MHFIYAFCALLCIVHELPCLCKATIIIIIIKGNHLHFRCLESWVQADENKNRRKKTQNSTWCCVCCTRILINPFIFCCYFSCAVVVLCYLVETHTLRVVTIVVVVVSSCFQHLRPRRRLKWNWKQTTQKRRPANKPNQLSTTQHHHAQCSVSARLN